MRQIVDAVYEHGVFKPVTTPGLIEGVVVRLTVDTRNDNQADIDKMIDSVGAIYDGLTPEEIDEIERIALDRSRFSVGRNSP